MSQRLFALLAFFLSGTTGLIYQVVWTRFMGGIIGNTHFSITVVVAVFMGGLGLGSFLGGRIADRSSRPLRLYGWITVFAGLACLLVPVLTEVLGPPIFGALYGSYEGQPEAPFLLTVRILFAAALLVVPTTFMGATLPALTRYFTERIDSVGRSVGVLYTINTLGAVCGAIIAGFFAVPRFGLWGCTVAAFALDLALGLLVIVKSRGEPEHPVASATSSAATGQTEPLPGVVKLALVAFALSGFANMLLQIAWTKAIILTIGNSTYAFSLIVTLFILGIAIGGGIVASFIDRVRNLPLTLGIVIFATGVLVASTIPMLGHFPVWGARWFDSIRDPSYSAFLSVHVLLVSAVILPSTIAMGMVFPIVGKIAARRVESVGSAIGSAYFWNTVGAILGTLISGFVLIPLLGRAYYTLYIGAALSLLLGAVLLGAALRGSNALRWGLPGGLLAVSVLLSFLFRPYGELGSDSHLWHPVLLSRGAYVYYDQSYYGEGGKVIPASEYISRIRNNESVVLYQEGVHAPIAVVQRNSDGEVAMRISGKVEASVRDDGGFNNDLPHQLMAGHLPMLLHPAPKQVLTLGLGGGVTLGTLSLYPEVEHIDSLEISQEVVDAARDHFGKANRGAIVNPMVRNVVGDGRNHIEYTSQRFDVMTSVPSNPWIAGIGNLFTVEFFEACRDRLNDGGIMCNWIHKVNMREEDFRTVLRTFVAVFGEHAQLWDLGLDCMLIGSKGPVRFDAARFDRLRADARIEEDLAALGIIDRPTFLKHYRLGPQQLRAFVGDGPTNTDNFPVLEFWCPYGLYGDAYAAYRGLTRAGRDPLVASWLGDVTEPELKRANVLQEAFLRLEKARAAYAQLLDEIATIRRSGESLQASLARATPAERAAFLGLSNRILDGLFDVAMSLVEGRDPWLDNRTNDLAVDALDLGRASSLAGTLTRALLNIASQLPADQSTTHLTRAKALAERDASAAIEFANALLKQGTPAPAIAVMERHALASDALPALLDRLGVLYCATGRTNEGLPLFERALAGTTDKAARSAVLQNKGFALQGLRRLSEAAAVYREALTENPNNTQVQNLLRALEKQTTSS